MHISAKAYKEKGADVLPATEHINPWHTRFTDSHFFLFSSIDSEFLLLVCEALTKSGPSCNSKHLLSCSNPNPIKVPERDLFALYTESWSLRSGVWGCSPKIMEKPPTRYQIWHPSLTLWKTVSHPVFLPLAFTSTQLWYVCVCVCVCVFDWCGLSIVLYLSTAFLASVLAYQSVSLFKMNSWNILGLTHENMFVAYESLYIWAAKYILYCVLKYNYHNCLIVKRVRAWNIWLHLKLAITAYDITSPLKRSQKQLLLRYFLCILMNIFVHLLSIFYSKGTF